VLKGEETEVSHFQREVDRLRREADQLRVLTSQAKKLLEDLKVRAVTRCCILR
jgi:phage shock protein A